LILKVGMFRFFETRLQPTAIDPDRPPPTVDEPHAMARFYWHFVRQAPGLIAALFAAGLTVAVLDITIPVFIGRIVSLVSTHTPKTLIPVAGGQLLLMIVVLLVIRPAALFVQNLITNQAIAPGLTNLVRWQNHWHVARQSWGFFQNDFAGRIATRVMQTGPSLRESVVSGTNAVWYILVYGGSAILLLSQADDRLGIPIMLWFVCYASLIRIFVPRMRERSRRMSEVRSGLTGRIVDSYTNILTVKLFARARNEDAFIRDGIDEHTNAYRRQLRLITIWTMTLAVTNAAMVSGTGALAVWLWMDGRIPVGTVAMAIPMAWQIANMAGWVAQNVTSIFENVGTVQDGMRSIARPLQMPDRADAVPLVLEQGAIRFEKLVFDYGRTSAINFQGRVGGVLRGIDLDIRPGERIGLIGRSGTGKSTLVNLLLHFFDPASGRILVDGQDIAGVTQESLRTAIGMVTQDTSLLHRSIRDNIRFGRPDATEADIRSAAERAHALAFIEHLEDSEGRRGFESHVGERGVKLSGGQRQRIAIARVILKDAPILVLDEATSALDSEVEAAIQEQLTGLMEGRTVIAIAHRLSTIAQMDRLVVLDEGKIAEQGTHQALLARGGIYASLWKRQSGAGEVRDDSRKIAPMSV
jgi:ATP-binding cassette subfamily B multidrug efflux pump